MEIDITTKFAGLQLKSPIIVGSSALTGNVNGFKKIEEMGAGAIVLKSIFEEEIILEYNNLLNDAKKYGIDDENLDYMDFKIKQDNLNKYINLIKSAKSTVNIPVIASINCITAQEWGYYTKKIEDAGADALELNIFALPSDIKKSAAEIEQTYLNIISEVKKNVKIPIILKMSHYFTNLGSMIIQLSKTGVDGIVLFNRYYSPDIDIYSKKIVASNVLSYPQDINLPLRWIALTSGKVNCSLGASTGIHDGEGLVKMLLVGADIVQVVSTIYTKGFEIIKEMNQFLIDYLKEQNLESIKQIRGLANHNAVSNPAVYERVQFMRYFSDKEEII